MINTGGISLKRSIIALLLVAASSVHADFEGPYSKEKWTQSLNGGEISLAGMPNLMSMVSSDDGVGRVNTDFTMLAPYTGMVSFTWGYLNGDASGSGLDPFGYLRNGAFNYLTAVGEMGAQTGTKAFQVEAGDTFGFRIFSFDSAGGSSTASVYAFAGPVPEPQTYALMLVGLGLLGYAVRRRSAIR